MLTQILAAIGNGLFIVVATGVALRLLLLWRRTREWPELLIGTGLLMPAAVALPCMVASNIGAASVAEVRRLPLAIGLLGIVASVSCLMAFTWLVFRRGSPAAGAFSMATAIGAAAACALFFRAIASAPAEAAPIDVHGPYSLVIRLCFEIWYAWMGAESLLEWRRARRRLVLDLSDPVLVNRFGLWGCMGVGLALNGAGAMALEAAGMDLMHDPLPAFWMALNGLLAGSLMCLAFVPPTRYLDWVTTRHRRRAHARGA